jgi:hypothetical protein
MHQRDRKRDENKESSPKKLTLQEELDNQALVKRGLEITKEEHRVKVLKEADEQEAQSRSTAAQRDFQRRI